MKIYGITFSPTGKSRAVSEEILKGFGGGLEWIDLCESPVDEMEVGSDSLCLFSVPCYGGRIPRTAAERLSKIHGKNTPAVVCITFGNRAVEDALLELSDVVENNGFSVFAGCAVVTEHNIMHVFGQGRPDASDKEDIQKFSMGIMEKLKNNRITKPEFPGNRPYKEWKGSRLPVLTNEKNCVHCGLCVSKCPVNAISGDGRTDPDRCINCMRCIQICPEKIRYVPEELLVSMVQRLRDVCEERKSGQFYV